MVIMTLVVLLLILGVQNSYAQGYSTAASNDADSAAHWASSSLPKGDIIYTCSGNTATFPWSYSLSVRDALCDVQWFFESENRSRQLVAMMSHGKFLPSPEFRERVAATGNAGLIMSNLSVADSGNFSVEVHVYSTFGNKHTLLQSHAQLVVSDHLMTEDGDLHTQRSQDVVLDLKTNRWSAQLQCGKFIFNGNPPFVVEWKTPTGEIRNSTEFRKGYFYLLLSNPVSGGDYTCRIATRHTERACLAENDTRAATYHVEMVEERLFLLENENVHLKNEVQQLKQLQQNFTSFEERTAKLEAAALARYSAVAFHATGLKYSAPSLDTPLVFSQVHYNLGNAYSDTTGYFVAPYDGLYYFISSTGPAPGNTAAYLHLYVNNTQIDVSYSYTSSFNQMSSVHGVVFLNKGQYVWIRSSGVNYWDTVSSFTGFQLPHKR